LIGNVRFGSKADIPIFTERLIMDTEIQLNLITLSMSQLATGMGGRCILNATLISASVAILVPLQAEHCNLNPSLKTSTPLSSQ